MTRGFVTIATGKEKYYRIAVNLLHSYRYFSSEPMPFTLICDRMNDYSREFDSVMIMENPFHSFLDKLYLPELAPYDETIFIDADCLAYRDLNEFWSAFENGSDFSAFGKDYPLDFEYAWFKKEGAGEFSDKITSLPDFIGGVYFLKKTSGLKAFSKTAWYIFENYHSFKFRQYNTKPVDEPVYALAMSVHGYTTAGERSFPVCFYPHCTHFKSDISTGSMSYDSIYRRKEGILHDAYMVHWGTGMVGRPAYRLDVYRLNRMIQGKRLGKASVFLAKVRIWCRYQGGRALRLAKRTARSLLK